MNLAHQLNGAVWRKSRRSNGNGGNNCVEVAFPHEQVAVRDSKDVDGPALMFNHREWAVFLSGAKDGEFDSDS